ncbi:MAG: hypothetical protein K2K55_09540 [Duncaniella sp.]|nr:hypothetical protein [Duncaniella sp.]
MFGDTYSANSNGTDARDYVANIRESQPSVIVDHDSVKIRSRFSPSLLHSGFPTR